MISKLKVIALVAALPMASLACGSDNDTASTSPASAAPSASAAPAPSASDGGEAPAEVRGVTADEVRLDIISSLTGPGGPPFPGFDDGVNARFAVANEAGGINGRQLKVVNVFDDQSDPAINFDSARKAVEQDKVFASIMTSVALLPQTGDYFAEQQVPFVGWGFSEPYCGNQSGFGWNGCLNSTTYANGSLVDPIVDVVKKLGKDPKGMKIAIVSNDDDHDRLSVAQEVFLAERAGFDVVFSENDIPVTTKVTDYTPYANDVLASNPDIVLESMQFGDVIGMSGKLKQLGYTGLSFNYPAYVPGLLASSPDIAKALKGDYIITQVPPQEEATPAIKQIEEGLALIGKPTEISLGAAVGWWSADVFLQMLEAAGPDVTAQSFHDTINGGFNYESVIEGDAGGALEFPKDHDAPSPCAAVVQVGDTTYEPYIPFTCYDAPAMS